MGQSAVSAGLMEDVGDPAVLALQNLEAIQENDGLNASNWVELSFKCTDLINMDKSDGTKSDPYLVLYKKQKDDSWKKVGNTEIIHDSLNPEFVTKIIVDYHFEEPELYKAEVWDSDDDKNIQANAVSQNMRDFQGSLEFLMHDVVTSEDQLFERPLVSEIFAAGTTSAGRIFITAEQRSS